VPTIEKVSKDVDAPGKFLIIRKSKKRRHRGEPITEYLHSDGIWRSSTYNNNNNKYTGYYSSIEEAGAILQSS